MYCSNPYILFCIHHLYKTPKSTQAQKKTNLQHQKAKWVIFICTGEETRRITKHLTFKDTHIEVVFRRKNAIQNILKPHPQWDRYTKWNVWIVHWNIWGRHSERSILDFFLDFPTYLQFTIYLQSDTFSKWYEINKNGLHMNDAYIDIYNPFWRCYEKLNTR
jgi:hypothetical protein